MPSTWTKVAAALGLRLDEVLRRTDKTRLAAGRWDDTPVAVKPLTDPDPFWAAAAPRDRRAPDLPRPAAAGAGAALHADGRWRLGLERLPGAPSHRDRHPARPRGPAVVDAAADAVLAPACRQPARPRQAAHPAAAPA